MGAFIFIAVIVALFAIGHCFSNIADAQSSKASAIREEQSQKKSQYDKLISECKHKEDQLNKSKAEFERMVRERINYYSHLAAIKAELETVFFEDAAHYLQTKKSPAYTAAENIRNMRTEAERYLAEKHEAEYKLAYICTVYPFVTQIFSDTFNDVIPPTSALSEIPTDSFATSNIPSHTNPDHPLLSTSQYNAYITSAKTERLSKAMGEPFYFQYPLQISATTISKEHQYNTTLYQCTCPDFKRGHHVCKHMLALALQVHALDSYKDNIKTLLDNLVVQNENYDSKLSEIETARDEYRKLQKALNDRYQTHPYLADMIANYKTAKIEANIKDSYNKRELLAQIKRVEKEKAMLQNQIAVYEYMFPILNEFKEAPPENLEQAISNAEDTGFHYQWLSQED